MAATSVLLPCPRLHLLHVEAAPAVAYPDPRSWCAVSGYTRDLDGVRTRGRVRPLRRAYQRAAEDLGIRVTTDGASLVDDQGERHPLIALVHDFGGGMHVFEEYDERVADVAWQRGNGFTVLGSGGNDAYDRESFIEALSDWGLTGDGAPPEWYTEQPEDE